MNGALVPLALAVGWCLQQPADLRADRRLSAVVSIRAGAESLESVCERLGHEVSVRLTAAPDVAGDLVVIFAEERPAYEVMTVIAEHFGWTWESKDGGYRIFRSEEAKKAEEKARGEVIWQRYERLRREAAKRLKQIEETDNKRLVAEYKALHDMFKADASLRGEDGFELQRRLSEVIRMLDPVRKVSLRIVAEMTDAQLNALRGKSRIVLSSKPTAGQMAIPFDVVGVLRAALAEAGELYMDPELVRSPYIPVLPEIPREDVAVVRCAVRAEGSLSSPYSLSVVTSLLSADGKVLTMSEDYLSPAENRPDEVIERTIPEALKIPLPHTTNVARALQLISIDGTTTLFSKTMVDGLDEFLQVGSKADMLSGYGKFLNTIAEAAEICLIADAYDHHVYTRRFTRGTTAGQVLDAFMSYTNGTWRFEDGWARWRSEDWPLMRGNMAPRSVLREVRDLVVRDGGLSLEKIAWLANLLTDLQCESPVLAQLLGSTWRDLTRKGLSGVYFLRGLHHIQVAQREALMRGMDLEFGSLGPHAGSMLAEAVWRGFGSSSGSLINDARADAAWLAHVLPTSYRPGVDDEYTENFPSGPPASATLRLETYPNAPVLALRRVTSGRLPRFEFLELIAYGLATTGREPSPEDVVYAPTTAARYLFLLRLSADSPMQAFKVGLFFCPSGAQFVPLSQLPSEWKEALDKEVARQRGAGGGPGLGGAGGV